MLNRLGGLLIGGWYLAVVWYGMDQDYIRREGLEIDEYAMVAGLTGLAWLVISMMVTLIVQKATRGETGSAGLCSGLALGVIAVLVDLPRLLLFRLARRTKPSVIHVANLAFLGTVAGFAYVIALSAEGAVRSLHDGIDEPVDAIGYVMVLAMMFAVVFMVVIELPRALLARRSNAGAVREVGVSGDGAEAQPRHGTRDHVTTGASAKNAAEKPAPKTSSVIERL